MTFLLANWKLVLVAAVIACLAIYGMVMRTQRDIARAEYAEFKVKVAQAAVAAAEAALKKTIEDEKEKEKADAENSAAVASLTRTIKRLRDERPAGGFLPPAAPGSASPERAAFDRAELERAIRALDSGVQGLVDEGSQAVVDLNTAKRWAQEP